MNTIVGVVNRHEFDMVNFLERHWKCLGREEEKQTVTFFTAEISSFRH